MKWMRVDPDPKLCSIQKDMTEKQQTTENNRIKYEPTTIASSKFLKVFFYLNIKSFNYELFGVFLVEKGVILYFTISTIRNLLCLIGIEP